MKSQSQARICMYHLGATIQSAADVFSLLIGLSEDSSHCQLLLGDCLFEELPYPRLPSMDGPHPKLIRVGIKLRPSWPNLEWLWKTMLVPKPYGGWWRPSFRLHQSSFLCLAILVLFPAFFSVSWFCLTGNPAWNTFLKTLNYRDFPGGPMAKTLCSQCRGPGLNPWSGN